MAYKYTGRADTLLIEPGGKPYRHGDMVPISKDRALSLVGSSRLHSFETADGKDLLDAETEPAMPPTTPAQAEAAKRP